MYKYGMTLDFWDVATGDFLFSNPEVLYFCTHILSPPLSMSSMGMEAIRETMNDPVPSTGACTW